MIKNTGNKCIKDGPHAHPGNKVSLWNPENAPGPMCDRHKNLYLQESDSERKSIDRDYTQPDKRTSAWKEDQAHEYQRERHRILSGRVSKP